MAKTSLSTQLLKSGQRFAYRTACYFNGQQTYTLTAEPYAFSLKEHSQNKPRTPWLMILSRACYQEQINSYPIKSVRELKQLLELQRPSNLLTRYFIGPYTNNQRLVHEVMIDPAYSTTVQQAHFTLPETLLLTECTPLGLTAIELSSVAQPSQLKLWFHRGPQQAAAVMQGGLLANEEAVRVALGVHSGAPTQSWAFTNYLQLLSENWWRFPLTWWSAARNGAHSQEGKQAGLPWPAMLASSAALLLLYASLSSGYLHFANQWRTNKMQQLSSDVSQHLAAREQLESDLAKLQVFAAASKPNAEQILAWNVVAFLKQKNINLSQVTGGLNSIEVGGETDSATDLVAQLNQLPGISQIEFISPVRRGRNGEVFRLRIQLVAN